MKQQLLRPPVANQTRPMEGYHIVVPRRLRRGRDVRTADKPLPVDARQRFGRYIEGHTVS